MFVPTTTKVHVHSDPQQTDVHDALARFVLKGTSMEANSMVQKNIFWRKKIEITKREENEIYQTIVCLSIYHII